MKNTLTEVFQMPLELLWLLWLEVTIAEKDIDEEISEQQGSYYSAMTTKGHMKW
jgi:hypothetical protein